MKHHALWLGLLGASVLPVLAPAAEPAPRLRLPVDCVLGSDCFVQQFPDMDAGPGASDPFCGSAAYDGHDGLDIRVRSMREVARGVPVVASAAGTVRGVRDGVEDRLAAGPEDREAVRDIECGNGVVVDHPGGWQTQYCHMRRNSVAVRGGDSVAAGDKLGEIGASGLAEFPHVHLSVRREGRKLDPVTGREVGSGCAATDPQAGTLFAPEAAAALAAPSTAILAVGLAGSPPDYAALVRDGPPPTGAAGAPASVVWGWFNNLRAGDTIAFRMVSPDGRTFYEGAGEPLPGNKAAYSAYAGRSRPLQAGRWTVTVEVRRDGRPFAAKTEAVDVGS